MNKLIELLGLCIASVIIGLLAFVVIGVCAFCLPFRWLIDWDVKRDKDKTLRDKANLAC